MDHPLKVYYPYAGKHWILHWSTHQEQGHLALASSMESILYLAYSIINHYHSHESFEIKSLSRIEMVSPSSQMCRLAAEDQHREDVNSFVRDVCFKLKEATDGKEIQFPSEFMTCDQFEFEIDVDYQPSSDDLKYHHACSNCFATIRLKNLSPEEFYQKYYHLWEKEFPSTTFPRAPGSPTAKYSQAPAAEDDEVIWQAFPDFGHHCGGAVLQKVDYSDIPECRSFPIVLFYYRPLGELDISALQNHLEQVRTAYKQKQAEKKQINKQLHVSDNEKRIQKILDFFQRHR